MRQITSLSPEKFLRTRARQLPLHTCLLNLDWEKSGFAAVLVARRQPSGYLTYGAYLVDVLCLGVKQTMWETDVTERHFAQVIDSFRAVHNLVPCPYPTAHALVWGALAFAADLGFAPEPDFAVSQYVLLPAEEAPLLPREAFGHNGRPYYVMGPYDDADEIIAQLERSAGAGQYDVMDKREEWNTAAAVAANAADAPVGDLEWSDCVVTLAQVDPTLQQPVADNASYTALVALHRQATHQPEAAVKEVRRLIKAYPDRPFLHEFLASLLRNQDRHEEADQVCERAYGLFPGHVSTILSYGLYLARQKRFDEVAALIGPSFSLSACFPERERFHVAEAMNFYLIASLYFVHVGDEDRAMTCHARIDELMHHFDRQLPDSEDSDDDDMDDDDGDFSFPRGTIQLKITLRDMKPPVWRRVQVPAAYSFYELHRVIQVVMGWTNAHLYEFELPPYERLGDGTENTDASGVRLAKMLTRENQKLTYIYDFGDNWEHQILVEKMLPDVHLIVPVCLTGRRAVPPEDCGGAWGYVQFLEAMGNARHPEHRALKAWYGGTFDPESFELDTVNRMLANVFAATGEED